jgi:CheY-like chemotaxis protein
MDCIAVGAVQAPAPLRVLLVEDEPAILEGMAEALLLAEVPHLQAPNAEVALALIARHPEIGVVVSDVHMPGMDGIGLVREARRARAAGADTLLAVLISAHYDWGRIADRHREGIVGVLTKPFAIAELLAAVEGALAEAAARRTQGR